MLNIYTWKWKQPGGRTTYTAQHVNAWARMMTRHLTIPHRLICITDEPKDIQCETIPLPEWSPEVDNPHWPARKGVPQCYRRLGMYRRDAAVTYGDRFVSMDLDCIVTANIDHLFDHYDDFRMFRGTSGKRPYNGSMMQMTAGSRPQVFEKFTPELAVKASSLYIGSDQAWIAFALGWLEKTWGVEHGVLPMGKKRGIHELPKNHCLLFTPDKIKPWDVKSEIVREFYR